MVMTETSQLNKLRYKRNTAARKGLQVRRSPPPFFQRLMASHSITFLPVELRRSSRPAWRPRAQIEALEPPEIAMGYTKYTG